MAKKDTKKDKKQFPIDERPVIFNTFDDDTVNFVGRYLETEGIFMLSLNDNHSEFIHKADVGDWWYIDNHPTIIKEVLNTTKKVKKKKKIEENNEDKSDVSSDSSEPHTLSFSAPPFPQLPPFLMNFVNHIQQETGTQFQMVNVRVVGEDDLQDLPNDVLEQILKSAINDEKFELASKIRDIIKNRANGEQDSQS